MYNYRRDYHGKGNYRLYDSSLDFRKRLVLKLLYRADRSTAGRYQHWNRVLDRFFLTQSQVARRHEKRMHRNAARILQQKI